MQITLVICLPCAFDLVLLRVFKGLSMKQSATHKLRCFRAAMSKIIFSFATNVANEFVHSPHFEDNAKK